MDSCEIIVLSSIVCAKIKIIHIIIIVVVRTTFRETRVSRLRYPTETEWNFFFNEINLILTNILGLNRKQRAGVKITYRVGTQRVLRRSLISFTRKTNGKMNIYLERGVSCDHLSWFPNGLQEIALHCGAARTGDLCSLWPLALYYKYVCTATTF